MALRKRRTESLSQCRRCGGALQTIEQLHPSRIAAQVKPSPMCFGRVGDTLARPYIAAPAKTVVGGRWGGAAQALV